MKFHFVPSVAYYILSYLKRGWSLRNISTYIINGGTEYDLDAIRARIAVGKNIDSRHNVPY